MKTHRRPSKWLDGSNYCNFTRLYLHVYINEYKRGEGLQPPLDPPLILRKQVLSILLCGQRLPIQKKNQPPARSWWLIFLGAQAACFCRLYSYWNQTVLFLQNRSWTLCIYIATQSGPDTLFTEVMQAPLMHNEHIIVKRRSHKGQLFPFLWLLSLFVCVCFLGVTKCSSLSIIIIIMDSCIL